MRRRTAVRGRNSDHRPGRKRPLSRRARGGARETLRWIRETGPVRSCPGAWTSHRAGSGAPFEALIIVLFPARGGRVTARGRVAHVARTTAHPRVIPVALALAFALGTAVAAGPDPAAGAGPGRPGKVTPTRVVPYEPGGSFSVDTDLRSESGYAAWMINLFLAAKTPLPPIGAAFARAERETGVNALYLVAHAMLESGYGTSAIARTKYNLFGYNAYDRDPSRYASVYASYDESVREVARKVRDDYLTPGARYWGGFPTLRAMNLYYASDPAWADKIAVIANRIEASVTSLGERGIRFRGISLAGPPVAGASVSVALRWTGHDGTAIPPAIGFAARWTPLAVAEASVTAPRLRTPAWTDVRETGARAGRVTLKVPVPRAPGSWRLEIRAVDAGGDPLPTLDNPPIPSAVIRVVARTEATIRLAAGTDGRLTASVRADGTRPVRAVGASGARTTLETWFLPLDPAQAPVRVAVRLLGEALEPGGRLEAVAAAAKVRRALRHGPVVVVARLTGDADAIGRGVPAAGLLAIQGTVPTLTALPIADPRTVAALARAAGRPAHDPIPAPLALAPGVEPGQVLVHMDAAVVAAAADYLPGAPAPEPAPEAPGGDLPEPGPAAGGAPAAEGQEAAAAANDPDPAATPAAAESAARASPGSAGGKGATSGIDASAVGRPRAAPGTATSASPGAPGSPQPRTASGPLSRGPEQATILIRTLGVGAVAGSPAGGPDQAVVSPNGGDIAPVATESGVFVLPAGGLAGGMRLVLVALVEPGSRFADPSSLALAWLPIAAAKDPLDAAPVTAAPEAATR